MPGHLKTGFTVPHVARIPYGSQQITAFFTVLEYDKAENHRLKVIKISNMTSLDDITAGVATSGRGGTMQCVISHDFLVSCRHRVTVTALGETCPC